MERIPIFSIHSMEFESDSIIKLKGRALDSLKLGIQLFDSNLNSYVVEEIEQNNKKLTALGIMIDGIISIKTEGQNINIDDFLFGEILIDYKQTISFDQAKRMAEEYIQSDLSQYNVDSQLQFMHDVVLEAECCWFFFYNPKIFIPEDRWTLRMLSAYAISKKGETRHTYNYLDDPRKLDDYLQAMSAYFKRNQL